MKTCLNICPSNYRQTHRPSKTSQSDERIKGNYPGTFGVPYFDSFESFFTIRAFFESNLLKSELDVTQIKT